VSYHTRNPQLNDEVKLRLPDVLTPAHHLVFSVYHVHVKKQSSILSSLKQVGRGVSEGRMERGTEAGRKGGREGGRGGGVQRTPLPWASSCQQ